MDHLTALRPIRLSLALTLSCLQLFAVGCGRTNDKWIEQRLQVFPAEGQILIEGRPLSDALVCFYSESNNVSSYARTDDEGRFKLTTYDESDGCVAGSQVVTITKFEKVDPNLPEDQIPLPKSLIPTLYGERKRSGLSAEVSEQGPNQFLFNLTKSP